MKAVPTFYRQPTEPVGEIFFRRSGPALWKGNVLAAGYENEVGGKDNIYRDAPEVTITYDRQGFRNPPDLTDWEIAVVGDSFTELGHLPYEELFTTILGERLNVRIKNLGVSYTGTLTQTFYLKEYGKAASTRRAVLVFFEGNDLDDIQVEAQSLRKFKATGQRPLRDVNKPSSFLESLYPLAKRVYQRLRGNSLLYATAYFISQDREIPVTLDYLPPGRDQLSADRIASVNDALKSFAQTSLSLGLSASLVYMRCKRRVLDGRLRFTANTYRKYVEWRPTDLPQLIEELARKNGIDFIDVTPALTERAKNGVLPYNPIWDTHLNREGSEAVAQALADALSRNQ